MSLLIKASLNPEQYHKADLALINYPGLSGFAKWVYFYIASRPPGWEIYASEIAKHCTEKIGKVNTALKQLQAVGLLFIQRERNAKTGKYQGRTWKLFGSDACKALCDMVSARKRKSPDTAARAHGKSDLLRSEILGSRVELEHLSEAPAIDVSDQAPQAPAPVQPERELDAKAQEPKPKGRIAQMQQRIAALTQRSPSPEQQAQLEARQKEEARLLRLKTEAERLRLANFQTHYGKYAALPVDQVIGALYADCIQNPNPHQDRKSQSTLQAWFVREGQKHLGALVDAFRLARQQNAYSAGFVITALKQNFGLEVVA